MCFVLHGLMLQPEVARWPAQKLPALAQAHARLHCPLGLSAPAEHRWYCDLLQLLLKPDLAWCSALELQYFAHEAVALELMEALAQAREWLWRTGRSRCCGSCRAQLRLRSAQGCRLPHAQAAESNTRR